MRPPFCAGWSEPSLLADAISGCKKILCAINMAHMKNKHKKTRKTGLVKCEYDLRLSYGLIRETLRKSIEKYCAIIQGHISQHKWAGVCRADPFNC